MTCAEVEQLRDLYVLGALLSDEADAVEEHLGECPICSARVQESWQVAQLLRQGVPAVAAPASAGTRLLRQAQDERLRQAQDERLRQAQGLGAGVWGLGGGFLDGIAARARRFLPRRAGPAAKGGAGVGIPLRVQALLASAAATTAVVAAVLGAQLMALQGQLQERESQLQEKERVLERSWQTGQTAAQVMGRALEHGGAMAPLEGMEMARDATGMLYYMPGEREGVLVVAGLPPLNAGEVYQLWLVQGQERTNGGTFYREGDGRALLVVRSPLPLGTFQALLVTNEPRGGSAWPRGQRSLWGRLKSV